MINRVAMGGSSARCTCNRTQSPGVKRPSSADRSILHHKAIVCRERRRCVATRRNAVHGATRRNDGRNTWAGLMRFAVKTLKCMACKSPLSNGEKTVCDYCRAKEGSIYASTVQAVSELEVQFSQVCARPKS